MKLFGFIFLISLSISVSAQQNITLWYNKPAKVFEEALPIGNGRIGGMVYGGIQSDRISLKEATLWSG